MSDWLSLAVIQQEAMLLPADKKIRGCESSPGLVLVLTQSLLDVQGNVINHE